MHVNGAMWQIFTTVECRISSRAKWYKNYKNRLRSAKVIVKKCHVFMVQWVFLDIRAERQTHHSRSDALIAIFPHLPRAKKNSSFQRLWQTRLSRTQSFGLIKKTFALASAWAVGDLKPNSITLAGPELVRTASKLVADRFEAVRRPASNQLRTRNVGQCPTWWPPCRI